MSFNDVIMFILASGIILGAIDKIIGNKFGLGWSTENVILVADPELEVDMS